MSPPKTFYITTPIYYVNDVPHIGHAYTTVAADTLARYHRLRGEETLFLTGTDEHGQKVQQAAAKRGVSPQQHADELVVRFQALWKKLRISNDDFIRTTEPRHRRVVQEVLNRLHQKGEIYPDTYEGWYCLPDERFWTEKDLLEGNCPDCGRPVEKLTERNYFFKMGKYQDRIREALRGSSLVVLPEARRNEVLGFLEKPLGDLCISRPMSRLPWGIPIPFDPDYVTYVWFDALVNYITVPGYGVDDATFSKWWPANIHLVGKDILTTHAVYWTAMLLALELPLPLTLFAHGWWTIEHEKMSKTRGNVVDPHRIADTFGVDSLRYFLLREVPFGQDGDFSEEALVTRINSDLANDLGNLLSRTLTMIERYASGQIPVPGGSSEEERRLQSTGEGLEDAVERALSGLEFHRALASIFELVNLANRYIETSAPWVLARDPAQHERLRTVLYHSAEAVRVASLFLYPFLPDTAEEINRQMGSPLDLGKGRLRKGDSRWGGLSPGLRIAKGKSLFPRIEKRPAGTPQIEPASSGAATGEPDEAARRPTMEDGQITIEEFSKTVLRVGKILAAERIQGSSKLLKLRVDLGSEERQVVAGIGAKYAPAELLGRRVIVVANLKPAKIFGVESHGMILAAGDREVSALATFLEEVPPGAKVR